MKNWMENWLMVFQPTGRKWTTWRIDGQKENIKWLKSAAIFFDKDSRY